MYIHVYTCIHVAAYFKHKINVHACVLAILGCTSHILLWQVEVTKQNYHYCSPGMKYLCITRL